MDIVASIGGARLQSRMPAGERGGWARTLNAGESVLGFFRTSGLTFYDDSGARIQTPASARDVRGVVGV